MEDKCLTKYKVLVGSKSKLDFPDIYYVNDKKSAFKLKKKFSSKNCICINS